MSKRVAQCQTTPVRPTPIGPDTARHTSNADRLRTILCLSAIYRLRAIGGVTPHASGRTCLVRGRHS
jgi:hypothetical protein